MTSPVYIIGHKNPDTDSICAALALQELKQKQGIHALAGRIGHLNPETSYILKKLELDPPLYMTTAKNTLAEIEIDEAITMPRDETLRHGWDLCLDKAKALYIVDENENYIGMATIGDISKVQMQDLNITKDLLKETPLENIVKCLKGSFILKGNLPMSGEVRISDKKLMERDLEGAIMVLSDHEDDMIKSMAKGCAVIVIAESFVPNDYIIEMAKKYGVTLISTNYNTMKIIQMIYRSIPIELIMTPASEITSFNRNEFLSDVEREMLKSRHSSYPVLNQGKIVGSVARYHVLKAEKKQFILVDHNEKKQSINDIDSADIVEIIDHHRIGDIETDHPIVFRNMIVGSSCTIIGLMYRELGVEMSSNAAKLIAYGIISDTMNFHSPTCTMVDKELASWIGKTHHLDFDAMATDLFSNTATIQDKSFDTILHRDSKEYTLSGKRIAISQVFIFDLDVVDQIKEDFLKYMEQENKVRHLDLLLMVFTNVEGKGSRFLYVGKLAHQVEKVVQSFTENGYVSRKKQIVPRLAQELA
ncbi:putative manganese-dependent inorganic diphosphatase [Faecalicoccus acidiformans]|uniref:inorganic diphosphatase n=1 Tax=Faecalicoccus acidiformans TaxID=915173 RepID=A0ABS2FN01_9FIRM|nr:putative manganese-dependent inorganic diphosphatase [Faecalicoccus acidiformans]MBM6830759.1 putative manganese-dependent inorganic diphosphatase [Faecalicoccus acidiformans]